MGNYSDLTLGDDWGDLLNPEVVTGWSQAPDHGSGGLSSGLESSTREGFDAPIWSPENPIFWLGVVLALASGFVYFSTSFKVGPVHGSAGA